MPDKEILKGLEEMQNPPKRKRGRPKGSKNKPGVNKEAMTLIDPKTGVSVSNVAAQSQVIARMGDERVSAFVQYHIDMMKMRQVSYEVENSADSSKINRLIEICDEAKEDGRKVIIFSYFL